MSYFPDSAISHLDKRRVRMCSEKPEPTGSFGLRILSIFIVLIASSIGAFAPIVSQRYAKTKLSKDSKARKYLFAVNFVAKYFGSGVIFATAFIHLLTEGGEALTSPCLGGAFQEYPMVYAIAMLSIFVLYLLEIISRHYVNLYINKNDNGPSHSHADFTFLLEDNNDADKNSHEHAHVHSHNQIPAVTDINATTVDQQTNPELYTDPKIDIVDNMDDKNLESGKENINVQTSSIASATKTSEEIEEVDDLMSNKDYVNQIFALFILEFGIIFHSVWVGLSLGVAGSNFKTLFVAIVFHQLFEGLGLSSRISECKWPKSKRNTSYYMAAAYALTTPIAVAVGVAVRKSFSINSLVILLVSGVADSISGGILVYNSFELMFGLFKEYPGDLKMKLWSYFATCWGVALMSLIGKWA